MVEYKIKYAHQIQQLHDRVIAAAMSLRDMYGKVRIWLITNTILCVLYLIANLYTFIFININAGNIKYFVILQIIFIAIIAFSYRKQHYATSRYKRRYNIGYSDWCDLADKVDWGQFRKRYLYKENELALSTQAITIFYNEFTKRYSPIRPYRNIYLYCRFFQIFAIVLSISLCIYLIYPQNL